MNGMRKSSGKASTIATNFLESHQLLSIVLYCAIAGIEVVVVWGLVDDQVAAHFLPVIVDEDVPHDGDSPSLKVGAWLILVRVRNNTKGGILIQVFCVTIVTGQFQRKSPERIANSVKLLLYLMLNRV